MAKQNVAEQETLGEAMNKTELFFEQNGRTIGYVFLGLLVLAALVFGYRALIVQPRAEKAAEMISEAQVRFEGENPDFELALLGDATARASSTWSRNTAPRLRATSPSTTRASATCARAIWRTPRNTSPNSPM